MQTTVRSNPVWMSSAEAAAKLGVSLPTLYSYVSRGWLHPQPAAVAAHAGGADGASATQGESGANDAKGAKGASRAKLYRRGEVERLARRNDAAHEPRRATQAALNFGLPVLESSLCLIEDGRYYYRGIDAVELAAKATLEDVAALLWNCDEQALRRQNNLQACPRLPDDTLPMPKRMRLRFEPLASRWALLDVPAGDHGAHWPLVQAMMLAATGCAPQTVSAPSHVHLHEQLAAGWGLSAAAAGELRRALVLVADHELNVSSFTARCVASTGVDAAAAVVAALGALSGPRHGAMSIEVESLWPQFGSESRDAARLERWLDDRPARIPGFGHALYPDGDPRAQALLARLPRHSAHDRLLQAMQRRSGHAPNLDYALTALTRELAAPPGAAFALLAIGRSVGWLAHVFEQRALDTLIRPRAAYVGPLPQRSAPQAPIGRVIRRR